MTAPVHHLPRGSHLVINVVLFLFAVQNGYDRIDFSLYPLFFNCSDCLDHSDSNINNSNTIYV